MLPKAPSFAHELFTVGVTGTNGKTSTTTFVAAALAALGTVVRVTSAGAFLTAERDEALGVSEDYDGFLQAMRTARARGARHAALELTSEALANGFALAWPCRVGVLTSFDRDHLDAHGSAEHYLASKAQLFLSLPPGGAAVLNAGAAASELVREVVPDGVRVLRFGVGSGELDVSADSIVPGWTGTQVTLGGRLPALPERLSVPAIGAVFAENALGALAAAIACGVPAARAAQGIARSAAPPGRFERVAERPSVVVDTAHTPAALRAALETARALSAAKTTLVFGVGGQHDREKRALMGRAAALADRVIVTNDNPRAHDPRVIADDVLSGLGQHADVAVELDRERAIELSIQRANREDIVLIAGRGHERVQQIGSERRALSDPEAARRAVSRRP